MNQWYENLSQREQRLCLLGVIVSIIALFYFVLWQPLTGMIEEKQANVTGQRELVAWMQETVPLLQARRQAGSTSLKSVSSEAALGVIEQSLKEAHLDYSLKKMTKDNSGVVTLEFSDINFDNFIAWLINLSSVNRLTVEQVSFSPTKQTGIINISMRIQFV